VLAVGTYTAARYDTMQMRMMLQSRRPGAWE
jgi:hypothetical protein